MEPFDDSGFEQMRQAPPKPAPRTIMQTGPYQEEEAQEVVSMFQRVSSKKIKEPNREKLDPEEIEPPEEIIAEENYEEEEFDDMAPMFQQMNNTKSPPQQQELSPPGISERSPPEIIVERRQSSDIEQAAGAAMFAIVGEKKSPPTSSAQEKQTTQEELNNISSSPATANVLSPEQTSDSDGKKFIISNSMEFRASAKLGKYRKKSSFSDENQDARPLSGGEKSSESESEKAKPKLQQQHSMLQKTHSICIEDVSESVSPSALLSPKPPSESDNHTPKMYQQFRFGNQRNTSLDVPRGTDADDDNRSQHSYRTFSSSRRQSTEDSIDTDDEYFCYEMRHLEELERKRHEESEYEPPTTQEGVSYADMYQPDEEARENLAALLAELKDTVRVIPPHEPAPPDKKSPPKASVYEKFSMATDSAFSDEADGFMQELNQIECEMRGTKKRRDFLAVDAADDDARSHSSASGATSGPDTPIASDDEEYQEDFEEDQPPPITVAPSKNDKTSPPKILSPPTNREQRLETEQQFGTDPKNVLAAPGGAASITGTSSMQENKVAGIDESEVTSATAMKGAAITTKKQLSNESSVDSVSNGVTGGSRWKLLKTLKERKIEEQNNQEKIKEEEAKDKDKVIVGVLYKSCTFFSTAIKLNYKSFIIAIIDI